MSGVRRAAKRVDSVVEGSGCWEAFWRMWVRVRRRDWRTGIVPS
jgi:hypothetical protein